MTTAASVLDERLSKLIGDWVEEDLTTALTTSAVAVSTNLNKWDNSENDHFNPYWVYVTEYANANVERKIYDYVTSGGSCSVRGGNFASDTSGPSYATCRFYRYPYTAKIWAINDAIRELGSSVLFRKINDTNLVTGNILPDGSFEDWTSTALLRFYSKVVPSTATGGTLLKTTTAGYYRGPMGTTSAKFTSSYAGDYFYISSDTYPRLLDLMGRTVHLYVWAYPETANDATITIYTKKITSTGTITQTLPSTTTCPALTWTLLKLENQVLNDDLTEVQIRFGVATDAKYVYFDNARVLGRNMYDYMLPETLRDGEVAQVYIQTTGYSDYPCDDLHPQYWERVWGYETASDGTYRYIRLPYLYDTSRQIKLIGTSPLSEVSAFSDTVEIDGKEVDLLVAYAAYCLFRNEEGVPSGDDTARYTKNQAKYLMEFERLKPSHRMMKPTSTLNLLRP